MFVNFPKFVLGQEGGGEGIVELIIFVFIIVAGIIKSLIAANNENKRKQIQKKPSPYQSSKNAPATAEKIRMQRERYEKFLENILQPKKPSQQPAKPQPSGTSPVQFIQRTNPPVKKVYTNQSAGSVPYSTKKTAAWHSQAEDLLDTKMQDIPAIPSVDTKIEQIPQFKEEHIQEDQQQLIYHGKPRNQRGKVVLRESTDSLLYFSDSEDLKKAILYTEILGRPICLRETEALFD